MSARMLHHIRKAGEHYVILLLTGDIVLRSLYHHHWQRLSFVRRCVLLVLFRVHRFHPLLVRFH